MKSISFSGGGFGAICYYLGIISYMKHNVDYSNYITLGSSAGSWVATIIHFLDVLDLNTIKYKIYNLFDTIGQYPINCKNKIQICVEDMFSKITDTMIKNITKKVYISTTEYIFKNKIYNEFESKDILINCLIKSSMLPLVVGFGMSDGSISNNQPILNNITITVNYIFKADISPSEFINAKYIFSPPNLEIREKLFILGYEDSKNYFNKKELLI